MQTIAHIHFTRLIKMNGRLHEFNFRKRLDGFYDTDTSDDRGNRIQFRIVQKDNQWHVEGTSVPEWIVRQEQILVDALVEQGTGQ